MVAGMRFPILASCYFPATGDDTIAGGIYCIALTDLATYLSKTGNNPGATGTESPRGGGASASPGTGPYPAQAFTDPSLPNHTVFAPKTPPPADVSLPAVAWGNGGCGTDPSTHASFLVEIASHGYVIAADGVAGGKTGASQSMVKDMKASLDWFAQGSGAAKYGNVNASALTAMGHSCGGLESMSSAYHDDRVKRVVLFNIAIFQDQKRYLLQEIKIPVAWFMGGPKDMGYPNAEKDYKLLPAGLPAYKASLDTGHGSTFAAANGGKAAKAAVAYLDWQYRSDDKAKARLLDPKSPGSLVSENWTVEYKNWP
ncbi:hypothetical protein B0T26DRAFT_740940 [Lasiosphaeria miniovina]|uniref:Chlorophyllase n=1 Tax=Lasiosphaeria miniovina TaxID=1954250 RepID=A0AA40DVZ2_9PEZI|nr:uncharacterized protein B0T26DRAFT_740940 [Lasiosphaeria miniovina]KAK0717650.1 hypothetical protein B0T26DRAFT_740940 [Lasiosphaeria miniovina]